MKLFLAAALVLIASSVAADAAPAFSKLALKHGEIQRGAYKGASNAASDKLYFVNNNQEIPGNMSLFEYDVSTKSHKVVTDQIDGLYSGVSGSAVCGDSFYYFGALAPQKWALVKVGISSGKIEYLSENAPFLFHKIECDPTGKNGTILAVTSSMNGPLTFSVVRYDTNTQSSSIIGSFPAGLNWLGVDTLFSFDFASNECWGSFVVFDGSYRVIGANLYKIQLTNGVVSPKIHYSGVEESKVPYTLFPGKNGNLMGIIRDQQSQIASLCTFQGGDGGISFDSCKVVPTLINGGIPDPLCGRKYYYTSGGGSTPGVPQGLYVLDLDTQVSTKVDDLGNFVPKNYVGAMAGVGCV